MTRLATAITTLAILTAGLAALPMGAAQTASAPIGFGMEASAIGVQTAAGVAPDYGSFWIGPWTLSSGWGGPDNNLRAMHAAGVTPAIHHYYWGDDISPDCVENGCWSSLHNTQKDMAGWNQLTDELIQHLNQESQGDEVVIFLESEFNKNGIQSYEPFDGYMADMADRIHAGYPNAKIVLGFGSWGTQYYQNFDRAAAASDYIGIQGLRGSTKDSASHYDDLFETTVNNARFVHDMFGKPVFIQDLGLSSYPEPTYLDKQAAELQQFFDNLDQLKAVGVQAIIYRSWNDAPGMNLANYYGEAERHWGLSWSGTDALKPAGDVWVAGVQAERGNPTSASATVSSSFTASFTVAGGSNEWWVEASAQGTAPISKVEASINDGAFTELTKQSWGAYAKSFHAPSGYAVFRATSTAGDVYTSEPMSWLGGSVPATSTSTASQPAPADTTSTQAASPDPFTSDVRLGSGNEWWVEAYVTANRGIAKVEASINDGPFQELTLKSWGAYAASFHAPAGYIVVRTTSVDGAAVESQAMSWLGGSVPAQSTGSTASEPAPAPANTAPVADLAVTSSDLTVVVDASGSSDADGDALSYSIDFGDGATATGATARHTYAAAGTYTVMVAVDDGQATSTASQSVQAIQPNRAPVAALVLATSGMAVSADASASSDADGDALSYTIDFGDGSSTTTAAAGHEYAAPGTYTVTVTVDDGQATSTASQAVTISPPALSAQFTPKAVGNEWWVEVAVSANNPVSKVQASVDGGAWVDLPADSWGTYAASIHVAPGAMVTFRVVDSFGQSQDSQATAWGSAPAPAFAAQFSPKTIGNRWWVETDVTANQDIGTVEYRVNGGAWQSMTLQSWGSYAAKTKVPKGGDIEFRATSTSGETDISGIYAWF